MAHPELCIDEKGLLAELPQHPIEWIDAIDGWLSAVEAVQDSGLRAPLTPVVWITSEFWDLDLGDSRTIVDALFYGDCYSIARDEILRLQIMWDRSSKFDPLECTDIELAVAYGHGVAKCVALDHGGLITRLDPIEVRKTPGWVTSRHVVISCALDIPDYFRSWMVSARITEEFFPVLSDLAFPNIYLHPDLNFRRFAQAYDTILPIVVSHLSFLNDHLQDLFVKNRGQVAPIQDEAKAAFGIDISPESPLTHRNEAAMRERDVFVGDAELRCEWHTKLFWDNGRIHFHPGLNLPDEISKESKGRVVVGKFADHLTT